MNNRFFIAILLMLVFPIFVWGAFPTTSIIDNFNRADNASLGANWDEGDLARPDNFEIVSNTVQNTASAQAEASASWNASTFGPDCEIFATLTQNLPADNGDRYSMACKIRQIGSGTTDFYGLSMRRDSGGLFYRVQESVDESFTDLGAEVGITFVNGDVMGLEVIGDTIKGYINGVEQISRTDSTLSGVSGRLGLYNWEVAGSGANPTLDDFGGGTVVSVAVTKLFITGPGI